MISKSKLIIVCQPSLAQKIGNKFYIIETSINSLDAKQLNELTMLGEAGIVGHIVAIENTFNAAKKIYKHLLKGKLYRANNGLG